MLRGFIGGLFWGVILIGGVLVAASLLSPLPATVAPQTTAQAPQETTAAPREDGDLGSTSQADETVEAAPSGSTPVASGGDQPPIGPTESAPKPEAGGVDAQLAAPAAPSGGAVSVEAEDPVFPNPQAMNPTAPAAETALSISTNPAQPAAPSAAPSQVFADDAPVNTEDSAAAPVADTQAPVAAPVVEVPSTETTESAVSPETNAPEDDGQEAGTTAADVADTGSEDPQEVQDQTVADSGADQSDDQAEALAAVDRPADTPDARDAPLVSEAQPSPPAQDLTPLAEAEEEVAVEAEETATSLLKPAGTLSERFEQRTSERLPTIGGDTEGADTAKAGPTRPVEANAEPFENPENKPMMAIALIDTAGVSFDMEALESFPYPLTIAVSTLDPEVVAKTEDYRARGFEVLGLVNVPVEATAADVEQAMQAHLSVSDQFVGIVEGLDGGLQGSKEISDQVAQALLGSGHGLLMFPNGLNTAQKLAAKEGVPSASVFRDFDDNGQSAVVMRRFLDQAAFKAVQEEGVVMVGRLRDKTISALLLWALQDRAGTVALGPISSVFTTIN